MVHETLADLTPVNAKDDDARTPTHTSRRPKCHCERLDDTLEVTVFFSNALRDNPDALTLQPLSNTQCTPHCTRGSWGALGAQAVQEQLKSFGRSKRRNFWTSLRMSATDSIRNCPGGPLGTQASDRPLLDFALALALPFAAATAG